METYRVELSAAQRDAAITAIDIAHRLLTADAEGRYRGTADRVALEHHARAVAELMHLILRARREWVDRET